MSPRQASLNTYAPHFIALTVLAFVSYSLYNRYNTPPQRGLRRSNARRVPRRRFSSAAHSREGDTITSEQLQQVLNGDTGGLPAGTEPIFIPESVAEGLTERGHAAQDARGAGDGREGRAGRGSSDQDSEYSFMPETSKEHLENQNLLTLLYTIAQDQATRESFVHRGVTCNNCQTVPIRGIRYRCANCLDYDLCEVCEALDAHPKTHLFLKIRIPAPFIQSPRHAQVPCYPGQPHIMPHQIPPEALKVLGEQTKFEQPEIEALYEQFKVLAETEYQDTRFGINGAISRNTFDRCFLPNSHVSPTSPNLIHDRMFAFYDSNNDNVISFDEFVLGVSFTTNKPRNPNRLRKIFNGYDLDGDGYIERKDFQRMFKAFYTLSKDVIRDIVASQGDDHYDPQHMDMVLMGRAPISAAFTSTIRPNGRNPSEKPTHPDRDYPDPEDTDAGAIVVGSSDRRIPPSDGYLSRAEDSSNGCLDDAEIHRRARFWAFKVDEYDTHETMDIQEGDEVVKLQFPEQERDVGSEVLFQMSMQGINELLDLLFLEKEKEAISLRLHDREEESEDAGKQKGKKGKGKGSKASTKKKSGSTATKVEGGEEEDTRPARNPESTEGSGTGSSSSSLTGATETPNNPTSNAASSFSTTNPDTAPVSDSEISPPDSPSIRAERRFSRIREEIRVRGGEGRLNFQEFEKIMSDKDAARKLEFVGTWTELASF